MIADSVNPVEATRAAWRQVAQRAGKRCIEIEIVCSDLAEHRRRVESRVADIAGHQLPTWQQVCAREYEPWAASIVIDTAGQDVEASVAALRGRLEGLGQRAGGASTWAKRVARRRVGGQCGWCGVPPLPLCPSGSRLPPGRRLGVGGAALQFSPGREWWPAAGGSRTAPTGNVLRPWVLASNRRNLRRGPRRRGGLFLARSVGGRRRRGSSRRSGSGPGGDGLRRR